MSRKSWDGVELMAALRSGLDRLESRVEEVNALNVFPVPDGDTGTNMLATLKAAIAEGDASLATGVTAIDEVSAAVARGALLGARGNSGVLLSQILRGLPQAVRGRQRARATEIAQSLSLGVLHAYSAVATPTEGTILTVAREVAAAAMKESEGASELRPFLESIAATARISVEKTPTLLAVLREAGVVDSGGAGLQLILEGIANVPSVAPSRGTVEAERRSASSASPKPAAAAPVAPVDAAPTEFGYETVFILSSPATPLDLAAIRAHLETIGESVLVAGDEVTCKVHVHNLRPDEVLAYGISLGDVRAVTIENLDQQSAERATGHAAFNQLADGPLTASARPAAASLGRGTSIVAVAAGAASATSCAQRVRHRSFMADRLRTRPLQRLPRRSPMLAPSSLSYCRTTATLCWRHGRRPTSQRRMWWSSRPVTPPKGSPRSSRGTRHSHSKSSSRAWRRLERPHEPSASLRRCETPLFVAWQ